MKKLVSLLLAALLVLSVASCALAEEKKTIVIGATPSPHQEVLELIQDDMAALGYKLEIVTFTEYPLPNPALADKQLDANYFQHLPYLEDFNAKNGTHLASVGVIHYEPMGLYPGKSSDLANIPDGAKIGIPGDNTNGARALLLLEAQGVLKLKEGVGLEATELDIEENPHNVEIVPMEAANLPASLPDLDFAVINGNYASGAGIGDTVLVTEDADSVAAQTYGNIVAVKEGNENNPAVLALVEALKSDTIKQYIKDNYNGIVMPME